MEAGGGVDTDEEEVRERGGIMGEQEVERRGKQKEKRGKKREIMSQFVECVHLASHPSAGLFELFAFWDALRSLLHILLSLQHPPLNVVHQSTLHKNKRRSQCRGGEDRNVPHELTFSAVFNRAKNDIFTCLMNV